MLLFYKEQVEAFVCHQIATYNMIDLEQAEANKLSVEKVNSDHRTGIDLDHIGSGINRCHTLSFFWERGS